MTPAAFLLAAGPASRFADGHKLIADFRGHPLVWWGASAALEAGFARVHVVWGAVDLADHVPDGVDLVPHPRWAAGQASSLGPGGRGRHRRGLRRLRGRTCRSTTRPARSVAPRRLPRRPPSPSPPSTAVRATRCGWLPRSGICCRRTGDEGARRLVRDRDDLVEAIPCPGDPIDIDTVEDLARWS